MRVLFVSQGTSVWGAELTILSLGRSLTGAGWEPWLAAPPGDLARRWQDAGLPLVALDVPLHRGLRRPDGSRLGPAGAAREAATTVSWVARLVAAIRRSRAQVVYSHGTWLHPDAVAAARLAGRPVVLHEHDLVVEGVGRRVLAAAARAATATIAISEAVAGCIDAPGRVTVIHQGVDTDRFRPGPADPGVRRQLGGRDGHCLVAVVGRVDPVKGVHHVIEALSLILPPRPGLAVVGASSEAGPGYLRSLQEAVAAKADLDVSFTGRREDLPDVYRAVDVVVSAADAEPYGLTIVEAMASGRPVVVTGTGGAPELVHPEETGRIVPPGDPAALAGAISLLAADDDLRRRMGAAGREWVQTHLDRRAFDARVADMLATAAGRGRHSP